MKRFYAVQHGDVFDWDYGFTIKRNAIKMANAMKHESCYDGEEIRIAVIDCELNYCMEELIIRDGVR